MAKSLELETDQALAAGVRDKDPEALAALYSRYQGDIFDFAARLTRDADAAGDIVQTVFLKAWEKLGSKDSAHVRPWLFVVARNASFDLLRARSRDLSVSPPEDEMPAVGWSDPEEMFRDKQMQTLVWEAAGDLSPSDYSLIDLQVRRGLDNDEISQHFGISKGALYTRMSRAKSIFEEAVTVRLLTRGGRAQCRELQAIIDATHPPSGKEFRQSVAAHISECDACNERRKALVAPASLLAGAARITPKDPQEKWRSISARINKPKKRLAAVIAIGALLLAGGISTAAALVLSSPSVRDPDVRSLSHVIGRPSSSRTIVLEWNRIEADGYSVLFDHLPQTLPSDRINLKGSATGYSSADLEPGVWYFHLRTNLGSKWTSTVHRGPFMIVNPDPLESSTAFPSPSPSTLIGSSPPAISPTRSPRPTSSSAPPASTVPPSEPPPHGPPP